MTPVKLIPLALACLALAAAGCGGSSKKSSGGATSTPAPPSTTSTPASGGKAVAVAAKNIKFVPAAITVKVGQTVRWSNQDPVPHTVTAESGATFDSPLPAGGTFEFTPTKPGKINYRCTIHQNQSGKITVTK